MTVELPPSDPQEEIERLRDDVVQLQRELTEARATATPQTIAELKQQLADAQLEITRLRETPQPQPARRTRMVGFFEVADEEEK